MNYIKHIKLNYALINLYESSKKTFPLQKSDFAYRQKVLFEDIKELVKEYKQEKFLQQQNNKRKKPTTYNNDTTIFLNHLPRKEGALYWSVRENELTIEMMEKEVEYWFLYWRHK